MNRDFDMDPKLTRRDRMDPKQDRWHQMSRPADYRHLRTVPGGLTGPEVVDVYVRGHGKDGLNSTRVIELVDIRDVIGVEKSKPVDMYRQTPVYYRAMDVLRERRRMGVG